MTLDFYKIAKQVWAHIDHFGNESVITCSSALKYVLVDSLPKIEL